MAASASLLLRDPAGTGAGRDAGSAAVAAGESAQFYLSYVCLYVFSVYFFWMASRHGATVPINQEQTRGPNQL